MALADIFETSSGPQTNDKTASQPSTLSGIFESPSPKTSSPQAIPTPTVTPDKPQPSLISRAWNSITGMFGGGNKAPKPDTNVAPPKATPSTNNGSLSSIFEPSLAPTKDTTAPSNSGNSSYFYGTTPGGGTIGRSDLLDTSGKPFLGFRNPGDTATSTDMTRIATPFDPTKPQKLDKASYLTPRAVDARSSLKSSMGGSYSDELDHAIALELSGSNDKSNLIIQPGRIGGVAAASDKLENSLAKDVANGKISLFDAQTQLAKSKGIKTPWTPQQTHSGNFLENIWSIVRDSISPKKTAPAAEAPKLSTVIDDHNKLTPIPLKTSADFKSESSRLASLSKDIHTENDKLNTLKNQVDPTDQSSVDGYNAAVKAFNEKLVAFTNQSANFNKSVDAWNAQTPKATTKAFNPMGLPETEISTPLTAHSIEKPLPPTLDAGNLNIKVPFQDRYISIPPPWGKVEGGDPNLSLQTPAANFAAGLPTLVMEAIPKALVTAKEEFSSIGKTTTKNLNPLETSMYGGTPEYKNVNADIQTRLDRGDGILASYIGAISQKTFDVAFGAQVAAGALRTLSSVLANNDINAQIEAWKTFGSPSNEEELNANYRTLAQQFHPDKTGGDGSVMKILNQAKGVLQEKGIPSAGDLTKDVVSRYSEMIGRETNLGEPILQPNMKVNPSTYTSGKPIPLKQLPGYAEENPPQVKMGLSTQPVKPVGFADEGSGDLTGTKTVPADEVKMSQFYPSQNKSLPLDDSEFDSIAKEKPELVQAVKDGTAPPIPVRITADGSYEPNADGASRRIIYNHFGIKDIPVSIEGGNASTPAIKSPTTPAKVEDTQTRDELQTSIAEAKTPTALYDIAHSESQVVPISKLNLSSDSITAAKDIQTGRTGNSKLPVLVEPQPDGTYDVLDGNHRVAVASRSGQTDFLAITDEKLYRQLAAKEESFQTKVTAHDRTGTGGVRSYVRNNAPKLKINTDLSDATYKETEKLTTKILKDLEGKTTVSKTYIRDALNRGNIKQTEKDVISEILKKFPDEVSIPVKQFAQNVRAELLPLTRKPADFTGKESAYRYENVSLPSNQRGNVAKYSEHVYQSPVKTSAGDVHFPGQPNYFGHTRVEDMGKVSEYPNGKGSAPLKDLSDTRRIIEVQSDLFQKGNLEKEFDASQNGYKISSKGDTLNDAKIKELRERGWTEKEIQELKTRSDEANTILSKRAKEVAKLEQYSNPTAHFRMVREEIRQAAIDGKTKLQFPTGETAMKIEGLGTQDAFRNMDQSGAMHGSLTPEGLRVGKLVGDRSGHPWVITGILEGGARFTAVPKRIYDKAYEDKDLVDHQATLERNQETFDISNEKNTNDPIYRFYEKDLGRYLKNNYDAKPITDKQGVTWYEVPIKPEMATEPVEAFKKGNLKVSAAKQGVPFNITIEEGKKLAESLFNPGEMDFLFPEGEIKGVKAWAMYTRRAGQNPLIQVVQSKGMISDVNLYHEVWHAYLDNFVSPEEKRSLINAIKNNPLTGPTRGLLRTMGYRGADIRAEEYGGDDFADYVKGKDMPPKLKSIFQRILAKIREWIRKLTGLQKMYDRILAKDRSYVRSDTRTLSGKDFFKKQKGPPIWNLKNMSEDLSVEEELAREAEGLNVINQKHTIELIELEEKAQEIEIRKETLSNNPAKGLAPFVARSGEFKGRLPEVTGGKEATSNFAKHGDTIITELGFDDSEKARDAWDKYVLEKEKLQKDIKSFVESKKELYEKFREDVAKYADSRTHAAGDYDTEITEANKGIVPPPVRGGLTAPEMDMTKFKDTWTPRLGRDTLERNLEKVAGPYKNVLKDFIVEPNRRNEVDRIHYTNKIRQEAGAKMKEWGIKVRSNEADMIQRFGEGLMSSEEVAKNTKNYNNVFKAAEYYRKIYDRLIDDWNLERAKFSYSPVPKRSDYFRHFSDINEFTNQFGFLRSESQLPTAIAGLTETFKPGKPFSTAELHRIGSMTSYDAIRGMDNYIDSVTRQMFHTDTVQRGRALEKYIRKVATENRQLRLPNFVQNIKEWTNLVSGKASTFDRALESVPGRPVMKFMHGLARLLGRNIVVGNISVAMIHLVSVPLNVATVKKVPFIRGALYTLIAPLRSEPITIVDGLESSFLTRRYPEKYIQATNFQKIENTLSFLFHVTDVFKSKLAVTSKYFEAKDRGLSKVDAMHEADTYAGRIVGDYSIGNRPNFMNMHATQLISQFQLGVNDGLSVLLHDIPEWEKEKGEKAGSSKSTIWMKTASRLVAFFVFSYLFNQLYKKMRGAGKGLDPINAGLTLAGMNDEGAGHDFLTRLKAAGAELSGELPFTSVVIGGLPLAQAFPLADLISGKLGWAAFVTQIVADFGSPIGGGNQLKKSIEGMQAYNAGQTTTAAGKTRTTIDKTPANLIKGLIFGKSAFSEVPSQNNETTRLLGLISAKTANSAKQAESLNQQFKAMSPADAAKAWDDLHTQNPALANHIAEIAAMEKEGMTLNERLVKQLGVTNGQRAMYIYNQMQKLGTDKERAALWDRYVKLKIISANVSNQITDLINKNK